jgi:hypothetical protein
MFEKIDQEHGSGTKLIDGWLQDDDTVKVQMRDGPAKE